MARRAPVCRVSEIIPRSMRYRLTNNLPMDNLVRRRGWLRVKLGNATSLYILQVGIIVSRSAAVSAVNHREDADDRFTRHGLRR